MQEGPVEMDVDVNKSQGTTDIDAEANNIPEVIQTINSKCNFVNSIITAILDSRRFSIHNLMV